MSCREPVRRRGLALLVLALLAGARPGPLAAQADLAARARQITAELDAGRREGRADAAAEQRAVEQLGQLVVGFIEASDRAAASGTAARQQDSLRAAFAAMHPPLEALYQRNSQAIERMARQVMDEDGDLEALYDSPPFRQAQLVASTALYYLNWLRYYGAALHDGARRRQLLEEARRGFSEFAGGDRRSELLVESRLGRGLCALELGDTAAARRDLEAVADDAAASPERRAKARLALLDLAVRTGNTAEALRLSEALLAKGAAGGDEPVVRFLRLQALVAAARRGGAEAERARQQALVLVEQLRRAGPAWNERVTALLQTAVDDPARWAGGAADPATRWELARLLVRQDNYRAATPLLEAVVASDDPQVRPVRREAQYLLGLARFRAGDPLGAADLLDAALTGGAPAEAADAAYMRFKALEAAMAAQPAPELAARFARAIDDFLRQHPDHRAASEGWFRLGELRQAERNFPEAIAAYGRVTGDPVLQLRARFASLQCAFELLGAAPAGGPDGAPTRDARLAEIGRGLEAFAREAAAAERAAPKDAAPVVRALEAKVAIMRAVYLKLLPGEHDAEILAALAGFETRYPAETDLLPQVVRLRLEALERLGRFAEARDEVAARGAALAAGIGRQGVEELAVRFIRAGSRRRAAEGDAVNDAAQRVALALYELVAQGPEASAQTTLTLARLHETSGDRARAAALYEQVLRDGTSPAALRGLARIAEADGRPQVALEHWRRVTELARPGDAPWYEGHYQVARLTALTGDRRAACAQLDALRPAMPGLSDVGLRAQLTGLYERTCR